MAGTQGAQLHKYSKISVDDDEGMSKEDDEGDSSKMQSASYSFFDPCLVKGPFSGQITSICELGSGRYAVGGLDKVIRILARVAGGDDELVGSLEGKGSSKIYHHRATITRDRCVDGICP